MKINYKLKMYEEIKKIKKDGIRPKLLLHACCAPCSTSVLEKLNKYFEITIFFYNPNISPESEFIFRLDELKRLLPEMGMADIEIVSPIYDSKEFGDVVEGMENLPEGGERCKKCYRLRLEKSVVYAKENGFDYVTTTLSVSPYKNVCWLNEIGPELAGLYGVKYLCSDFKKEDGYKRSCELSNKFNLYRQNYCGCIYSKRKNEEKSIKIYKSLPSEAKIIREEVFVKEQGFKEEYDEIDRIAAHIVLYDGDAIGTCRIYEKEPRKFMFGRLAVRKNLRKSGFGSKLVKAAEDYARENGGQSIILHSQLHAQGFYEKQGFAAFGEVEYEQDCPHIWMKKEI